MTDPLDFPRFAAHVSDGLGLEADAVVGDARLVEDLGLDSFDLVELLTLVEELGVRFPDDVAVTFDTIGDVYRAYTERVRRD
ncbi:MAG: phosphopantetheine-binding protein [Acidimicrobiales bacterium]